MKSTRGRVALQRETYDKLIQAFRAEPGAINQAARLASCSWQLAKRVWSGPRFKHYDWAIPATELFEEERAVAMARAREADLERVRQEERRRAAEFDAAREQQIETLKQENLILKGARGDVLQAVALAAELGPAMRNLAKVVNEACKLGPNGEPPQVSAKDAMSILGRHALIMQRAVGAAGAVLDQGKVNRGEPTSILGLKSVSSPANYEDALAELEEMEELLVRARDKGIRPRLVQATGEPVPPLGKGGNRRPGVLQGAAKTAHEQKVASGEG